MAVEARLDSVTLSDGTEVEVARSGVTLFVGPNNAGKSQALRDIEGHCTGPFSGRCVVDVTLHKGGTQDDFREWVRANVPSGTEDGIQKFRIPHWAAATLEQVVQQWTVPGFSVLRPLFVFHANAIGRLTGADAPDSVDFSTASPSHPIHQAYLDGELETKFSSLSRAAFGLETVVDRFGGSKIPLRVGSHRPEYVHKNGVPSADYLRNLRAMPRLQDQGDGVKSYMGLLLHVFAGNHAITLVDEPEAFLHPPQARMLGELLARRSAESGQQVIMATHSVDVVQGVLNSGSPATIIRLTRDGDVNHASVLRHEDLKELWKDSLLKHSNVLDGLFHDAVVLCEADSDCRLYSAVLESIYEKEVQAAESDGTDQRVRNPQILFTHCGGKARLPVVAKALTAVAVPTLVVADFDLLRDGGDVKRVLEGLGGDFSTVDTDLKVLDAALKADEKPLGRVALKEALDSALDRGPDTLNKKALDELKRLLRLDSGWEKVKKAGVGAVPQGQASKSCANLLQALREQCVLVVPVGYLERFIPQIGGHGPSWVSEVLTQGLHEDPSHHDLRTFVGELLALARARS